MGMLSVFTAARIVPFTLGSDSQPLGFFRSSSAPSQISSSSSSVPSADSERTNSPISARSASPSSSMGKAKAKLTAARYSGMQDTPLSPAVNSLMMTSSSAKASTLWARSAWYRSGPLL